MGELKTGIYDHLISKKLRQAIESLDASSEHALFDKLEEPLATDYLTRFLRIRISKALRIVKYDRRLTQLHWESQSNTAQDTPTGQNYIFHQARGYTILFFARLRRNNGKLTSNFTFLGDGRFLKAEGDRPIAMEWQLSHAMSAAFYHEAKLASGL